MNQWIAILLFLLVLACNKQEGEISISKTVLTTKVIGNKIEPLKQKESIEAGSHLFYDLVTSSSSEDCILIWRSVFGDRILQGTKLSEEVIRFYVPKQLTQKSGLAKVLIYQKGVLVQNSEVVIKPLEATGISESFLGPRSIIIDKDQVSMLSVIPLDKFRNPMPDNYKNTFRFKYPKESVQTSRSEIKDFVSYKYFSPMGNVGKIHLAASAGNGNTLEEEILVVPGQASNFEIFVENLYPYADARQHLVLKSSEIKDIFGNSIADGTLINFVIKDQSGKSSFYNGISIGGIVEVNIENPSSATNWSVQAFLYGVVKSNDLNINFIASMKDFEVTLKDRVIHIGPVIGPLDQIVSNGTEVLLILNGDQKSLEIIEGMAIYEIPDNLVEGDELDLTISILGKTKQVYEDIK